jgi:hypothetical protein
LQNETGRNGKAIGSGNHCQSGRAEKFLFAQTMNRPELGTVIGGLMMRALVTRHT